MKKSNINALVLMTFFVAAILGLGLVYADSTDEYGNTFIDNGYPKVTSCREASDGWDNPLALAIDLKDALCGKNSFDEKSFKNPDAYGEPTKFDTVESDLSEAKIAVFKSSWQPDSNPNSVYMVNFLSETVYSVEVSYRNNSGFFTYPIIYKTERYEPEDPFGE